MGKTHKDAVVPIDTHIPRQQRLIDKLIEVIEEEDDGEVLTTLEVQGCIDSVRQWYIATVDELNDE